MRIDKIAALNFTIPYLWIMAVIGQICQILAKLDGKVSRKIPPQESLKYTIYVDAKSHAHVSQLHKTERALWRALHNTIMMRCPASRNNSCVVRRC